MTKSPKLFRVCNPVRTSVPDLSAFTTPLGRLELRLEVDGVVVLPATTFTAGLQYVAVWADPLDFELLLLSPRISLPSHMAVTGALAAVWRVGAADIPPSIAIKCVWATGASWTNGSGGKSGQNLDAQAWTDGRNQVMVGLPDFESATNYRDDGFEVEVGLVSDRQGHFVCAWGPDTPGDVSTWFAVDWSPAELVGTP